MLELLGIERVLLIDECMHERDFDRLIFSYGPDLQGLQQVFYMSVS